MIPMKIYQFSTSTEKYTIQESVPLRTMQHKRSHSNSFYKQLNKRARIILNQHPSNRNEIGIRQKLANPKFTVRLSAGLKAKNSFRERLDGKKLIKCDYNSLKAERARGGVAWFKRHINRSNLRGLNSTEVTESNSICKKTTTCQTEIEEFESFPSINL